MPHLLLTLRADNEKVASYLWREPFATMVRATEILGGGDEQTSFELMIADLVQWFIDNPTPPWKRQLSAAATVQHEMTYRY